MAVEPLSIELIDAGAAMTAELDRIGLSPQGTLWLHWHYLNDWRFTVVSDLVEDLGRMRVYSLLDKALEAIGPVNGLTIFDVHLAASTELMAEFVQQIAPPISLDVTYRDCVIGGQKLDAHIYRSLPLRNSSSRLKAAKRFEREVSLLSRV